VTLTIRRQGEDFHVGVTPVHEGVNASLLQAMKNSVRSFRLNGFTLGYVHLWSGTCPEILQEFRRIVTEDLGGADGILLDLRDGWGGAWYEYLDPFFQDRSGFYTSTVSRRGQRRVNEPPAVEAHRWFSGPLVVLVNEGTRSGKEALAFQFKKAKRAVLVGTRTAGAFTGGSTYFRGSFALYVPYNGPVLLDGQQLEGRGVMPDVGVEDPLDSPAPGDPQLQEAKRILGAQLSGRQ
jgi:carboxyl-terminal processing protease